jgi:hypothetical protein
MNNQSFYAHIADDDVDSRLLDELTQILSDTPELAVDSVITSRSGRKFRIARIEHRNPSK